MTRSAEGSATFDQVAVWPTVLRAVAHALTGCIVAWPLSVPEAQITAAVGAAVGVLIARQTSRTAWRSLALLGFAVLGIFLVLVFRQIMLGTDLLAASLGPSSTLRFGDAFAFGLGALCVSFALCTLSFRRPSFAVLEVIAIGLAFAQPFVAHRYYAINRPFEIADPILASGGDPEIAFVSIGAITAAIVMLLLLRERSVARSILHLGVVALILLLVGIGTRALGPPAKTQKSPGLGLRGEEERGGKNRRSGARNQQDERLDFRDNYQSPSDRVPVAIVLFHDDYSPPGGLYYFRQAVFSQYNGKRLVAATRSDADQDVAPGFPGQPTDIANAPSIGAQRTLVRTTVAMLVEHYRPFGLESPVRFEPGRNPDPTRFKRAYQVASASLTGDFFSMLQSKVGSEAWSREQWAHYTTAPNDPRYRELTERVVREMPEPMRANPVARALAISAWLSREGLYSLRSRHATAEDPTADFLFGDRTGYCVHFAHAAAYMMRSIGLPARVANGYAIDEAARQGGSALLLYGHDSHAWPEVYVDGVGWVVVDVYPERTLDPPPQPPDPELQRLLAQMLRGERPMGPEGLAEAPWVAAAARRTGSWIGGGTAILAALVLLTLLIVKTWRRFVPLVASEGSMSRVVYRASLDRLSDVGKRRQPGESREGYAQRLGTLSPSFASLTATHVGMAYGTQRRAEPPALLAMSRAVQREVRAGVPWWRRVLGVLIPWSWLQSK